MKASPQRLAALLLASAALGCTASAWARGAAGELADLGSLATSYWRPAAIKRGAETSRPILVSIDRHGLSAANDCFNYDYVLARPGERPLADRSPQSGGPACRPVDREALRIVDNALRGAASARLRGRALTLRDRGGEPTLRLTRFEPVGFEDRHWSVGAYRDGRELVPVAAPYSTLMFSHGWLTGSPVCGGFMSSSSYRLKEGTKLRVSAGYILASYCRPASERAVGAIMRIFRQPLIVERRGSGFALRDTRGEVQIVLTQ